jgi:hypothetical protein
VAGAGLAGRAECELGRPLSLFTRAQRKQKFIPMKMQGTLSVYISGLLKRTIDFRL